MELNHLSEIKLKIFRDEERSLNKRKLAILREYMDNPDDFFSRRPPHLRRPNDQGFELPTVEQVQKVVAEFGDIRYLAALMGFKSEKAIRRWIGENGASNVRSIDRQKWLLLLIMTGQIPPV